MSDDPHVQIMKNPPPLVLVGGARPTPATSRPTCPQHCSGRHQTDGVMRCVSCGTAKYQVVAHEFAWQEGHHFYSMEPLNGAPPYDGQTPTCCGKLMRRATK